MKALIKAAVRIIIIIMFIRVLVMLANNVSTIPMYSRISGDEYLATTVIYLIAGPLVGVLILILLWWKTDWLVRIISGNIKENELVISTSNLDLIRTALGIFGIYLLATSIPDLIGISAYHIHITSGLPERDPLPEQQATLIKHWATTIPSILIGIWLVSGLRGIRGLIKGLNNFWNRASITDGDDKE